MDTVQPSPKPLRLWPGIAIVAIQLLVGFVAPLITPDAAMVAILGGVAGGLAVLIWWAFFSRAHWVDRVGGVLLVVAAMFATRPFLDKSIATGMMGFMFIFVSVPFLSLAFVLWAVLSRRLPDLPRRASMVATLLIACGAWTLVRTDGIRGEGGADFAWRWTPTPEERLIAQPVPPPAPLPTAPVEPAKIPEAQPEAAKAEAPPVPAPVAEWPNFRGPGRDSVAQTTKIKTDWAAAKPVELWRRPVGPGWSSFALLGDRLYTQEQRGEDEVVACYSARTGDPIWIHRDAARFWEANAGAGPRGTPTISGRRVYTLGATGILNALDAETGKVFWSRNAASDTGAKTSGWGFSGSPLVVGDSVVVATAGQLASYDAATGKPRWKGPAGGDGYSSPHRLVRDGVEQILLMSAQGVTSVAPADGKVLWKYEWKTGTRIVQPAVTPDGDLLISGNQGDGMRRVSLARAAGAWTVEDRWTSNGLKPYFNDFVVHDGHVYGFDGAILSCIDLKDGQRRWKGGRYGNGQMILLREQGLLLVLSEEGELALVRAAPDQFTEVARMPALEGKTWNHPVLVGDRLFVRNSSEMAAFKLATDAN